VQTNETKNRTRERGEEKRREERQRDIEIRAVLGYSM
jgi:hypothetical protein